MAFGLLQIHSLLRWVLLIAGAVALGYALYGVLTKRPYDRLMRSSASAFAGLLHLQVVLGFFIIVSMRLTLTGLIGHIFLTLGAAVAAQVPLSMMRRRRPEDRTFLPHLLGTALAFILLWLGMRSINRGLFTTFYL